MRKHFLTGLAILLPVVLTTVIVSWLVNFLTKPFIGFVAPILESMDLLDKPFLFLNPKELLLYSSRILILMMLFLICIGIGFLTRLYFLKQLIRLGDWFLHRIPLVNKVYKASKDVVTTIFEDHTTAFQKVALVPYPHSKSYCLGLITSESLPKGSTYEKQDTVSVFVPGAPNPTIGFMILFRPEQIIPVDMKVEDALRTIVSCGALATEEMDKLAAADAQKQST